MSQMSESSTMELTLKANGVSVDHLNFIVKENSTEDHDKILSTSYASESINSSASAVAFRCERCDNFETTSRATLLLHVVQCLSSPSRLKSEEPDPENLSVNADSHNSSKQQQNNSRKVFECDVCNMKFSNGANMRRHKMRHTGVKPYECRVCQKRFFRKDHLAEHFTTHTKTLPYHCPICNRGFQRQIAMRAHFQNEHVGQHDLVKTCPLCSYRAGSMKSLRIHFFNRHGIDLDNPGPGGPSSLLLALESQASQAAAAAVAAFAPNVTTVVNSTARNQSDSGESLRSTDNATPPMHFLTPHVEISMSENGDVFNGNGENNRCETPTKLLSENRENLSPTPVPCTTALAITSSSQKVAATPLVITHENLECNSKIPSSTSSLNCRIASPKNNHQNNHITPSISLIPIKQEPVNEDAPSDNNTNIKQSNANVSSICEKVNEDSASGFNSPSLIKVSPLKSLLREDLKRRICARANNRIIRNTALENNNVIPSATPQHLVCNSTSICNGTITSSGQETEASLLSRKQILACLFCGIEFPDETLYFLHKGCHSESNPWKCNICGEQCNNVYEFNSHLLSKSHQ